MATITLQDAKEFGYCSRGARRYAMRLFGDGYRPLLQQFIREGVDESVLLATGDAQLAALVEYVRKRDAA